MSAGNHQSTVVIDGKADGLNKAAREASNRVGVLEATVEQLREALAKASQRLDEQTAALERHRQQVRADAEATRQARAEQKEWASAIRRAKAEIAAAEKAQADAAKKAKAEFEAQVKGQERARAATAQAFDTAEREREAMARKFAEGARGLRGTFDEGTRGLLAMASDASNAARGIWALKDTVIGTAREIADLANESLRVQGVFRNLPFDLTAAQAATNGLADDFTLARFSIAAHQAGVAKTSEEYAKLVGTAQTLALKMGRDVGDTIERVTLGIAKQEREILDELVVLPRMEEMWRRYAATLGKTTGELTDAEKTAAFTQSALEALAQAADGADVEMDGLAASIAKTAVEAKNLQTELLGGGIEKRTRSFAEGVRQLDAELLRQIASFGTYGSAFDDVRRSLRDAGVDVEKYRNDQGLLARDLLKVLEADKRQLTTLAERHQLTVEQIDAVERLRAVKGLLNETDKRLLERDLQRLQMEETRKLAAEAATAAEAAQRTNRILEIEEQLAFGRAAQIAQEQINALVAEEAELRAQVLEAEGKSAEAAELRRRAFLDALAAEGERSRTRRRGGARRAAEWGLDAVFGDTERVLERLEAQERRAQASLERTGKGATARFRELHQQLERSREAAEELQELFDRLDAEARMEGTPFDLESFAAVRERDVERRLQRAELKFESEQRFREDMARQREQASLRRGADGERVEAYDSVQLLEQETHARLALLDVRAKAANSAMELEQIENERNAALHALKMARLDEEITARRNRLQLVGDLLAEEASLQIDFAATAVRAALLEEGSIKRKLGGVAKANAVEFGVIQGPRELILAGIAAASFNPAGAAAHLKNAGTSFAFAASMAAVGGALGWGRAGTSSGGGAAIGAEAFGRGGGGVGGVGGGIGRSSTSSSSPIPESPEPQQRQAAGIGPGAMGNVVNVTIAGDVIGTPRKEFFALFDRGLRDYGYATRRVS